MQVEGFVKIYKTVWRKSPEELDKVITEMRNAGWTYVGGATLGNLTAIAGGGIQDVRPGLQVRIDAYEYYLVWVQAMEFDNGEVK